MMRLDPQSVADSSTDVADGDPLDGYARRSRTSPIRRLLLLLAPVIGVVGFLAIWQLSIVIFDIKKFVLPSPWNILGGIKSDPMFYVRNARTTVWESFLGFTIAFLLAMLGATIMALSKFAERAILPLAVLLQVTPLIAYAPAIVIWQGFGLKPILIMTSLVCFVPFLINGVLGLRSVDPNLLELARSVDASRREEFFRLRLPSALPSLFSAGRIAVGLALIGSVLGEFFSGSTGGLGYSVKTAQAHSLTLQLWGSVFVLAFVGAAATMLIIGLERITLQWHSSQRP